jgi:hypothetical protein
MSRIVILLLVLRMFAAPIAARPVSTRPYVKAGFIVRVCAWPAKRSHDAAIGVCEHGGCWHGEIPSTFSSATTQSLAIRTRFRSFDRVVVASHGPGWRRRIDSPRC